MWFCSRTGHRGPSTSWVSNIRSFRDHSTMYPGVMQRVVLIIEDHRNRPIDRIRFRPGSVRVDALVVECLWLDWSDEVKPAEAMLVT